MNPSKYEVEVDWSKVTTVISIYSTTKAAYYRLETDTMNGLTTKRPQTVANYKYSFERNETLWDFKPTKEKLIYQSGPIKDCQEARDAVNFASQNVIRK
jgi:hypothetical protein